MADNITLNAGSLGATLRTDDDGAAHWQYVKLAFGADNTQTIVTSTATNPLPVALSDTDNAVLDNIQSAVELIDNAVSGSEMQVDIVAVAPDLMLGTDFSTVFGTASLVDADAGDADATTIDRIYTTAALQIYNGTTLDLVREGGEAGSILVDLGSNNDVTVTGTVTANAGTNLNTSSLVTTTNFTDVFGSAAVAGTDGSAGPAAVLSIGGTQASGEIEEIRVDSDGHLQVDVLSGGGAGTEYTEDAVAAADPAGGVVILVRDDTPGALTSTDGDNVAQRGTNYGAAFVQVVTSSGAFVDSFGGSGGTSHQDDAAFSIGSASSITPTGYLADETTPDSVDEGDVGVPRMTLTRKPYAVITDATSENNAAVDGAGHLQVDIAADSVGIGGGTQYTEDAAAAADPVGNALIAVRDDNLTSQVDADGDNVALRGSAYGALYTAPGNFISTNNSTTATLTASSTFTGTGDDVSQFTSVSIQIDASHDSGTDGMTFQFSTDNTNWDDVYSFTYTAADGARRFQFPVTAQYFRFVYTNGGTGQTHFRVQTILHAANLNNSVHRLGDNVSTDRSATVVKSAIFAQINGTGDFVAVDADAQGNLDVGLNAVGGTAIATDIGSSSAGTQRVVLASDQPAVSVTGTVTANAGTNLNTSSLVTTTNFTNVFAANAVVDTEDDAATANPDGIFIASVRDDEVADTDITTTDGDVQMLRSNSFGMLKTTELWDATSSPKFAVIDASTSGDNTLVSAAGAGIKIRVLSAFLVAAGTVNTRFESGAAGTALTGQMNLVANSGYVLPYNPAGWFETADNTLLNLELSAGVSVDGSLTYVEV